MPTQTPRTFARLLIVAAVAWASLAPRFLHASCNLIPSAETVFPSNLGAVSTPFARPGDVVTVRRESAVFAADPLGNEVAIRFQPPGGPATALVVPALAPTAGSPCAPSECSGALCRCLSFVFPDTDAAVGGPADGHTLAGPVKIKVQTAGTITALIEDLFVPGSKFKDAFFPSFVGLPPPVRFADLVGAPGGEVLAAVDGAGALFIPFDFAQLLDPLVKRTRFLEAHVPSLGTAGTVVIDVFTKDGRRLPPLVRQIALQDLLGTADADGSVLRIAGASPSPALAPEAGKGPVVIPDVVGAADPRKRADPITLAVGQRYAVYENRECGPFDAPLECGDLNGDGDLTDRFLFALDVTRPGNEPITIDQVDAGAFPGTVPPFALYAFAASDQLVAFRIPETLQFDINGNGQPGDLIRSGAFDLVHMSPIALADGSPRTEIAEGLLAFSFAAGLAGGPPDALFVYDVANAALGPQLVQDATHPFFAVTRYPTGETPFRTHSFDIAASAGRVAFVVPEAVQEAVTGGGDLTGDGDLNDTALLLLDAASGGVTNLRQSTLAGLVKLSPRWLVFDAEKPDRVAVGLVEAANPLMPPRFICDDPFGFGLLTTSLSDTLIPCVKDEIALGQDLNGDGDAYDGYVLHVFLPDAPGGPVERNLQLALFNFTDPQVMGNTLAVGVDETQQSVDLDGDGAVGPGPLGPFVLHVFNGLTDSIINFRQRVAVSFEPFLQFIDRGLILISPSIVRTIFRDLDGDGSFEEVFEDATSGQSRLADNCPTVANPLQEDIDQDGIGDACDPLWPGGGASDRRTCIVEFAIGGPGPAIGSRVTAANGRPCGEDGVRCAVCRDGDPGCDFDQVAGQCTFRLSTCLLVADARLPVCAEHRPSLTRVTVDVEGRGAGRQLANTSAEEALIAALDDLPATTRLGRCRGGRACANDSDCPGMNRCKLRGVELTPALLPPPIGTPDVCTKPIELPVRVSLAGSSGRRRVTLQSRLRGNPAARVSVERSTVSLECLPGR